MEKAGKKRIVSCLPFGILYDSCRISVCRLILFYERQLVFFEGVGRLSGAPSVMNEILICVLAT